MKGRAKANYEAVDCSGITGKEGFLRAVIRRAGKQAIKIQVKNSL